jgi:hypothetical protein
MTDIDHDIPPTAPDGAWLAALAAARTSTGASLLDLSRVQPVLVVFLRHFG